MLKENFNALSVNNNMKKKNLNVILSPALSYYNRIVIQLFE